MKHTILSYDGSFSGILCAVFYVYSHRCFQAKLQLSGAESTDLFSDFQEVITNEAESNRVWQGIIQIANPEEANWLYRASLANYPEIHQAIFRYLHALFQEKKSLKTFEHLAFVRAIHKAAKLVVGEEYRMHAFVRFTKLEDGLFAAPIAPKHHVLPILGKFFAVRYADQPWLIYDVYRKEGIYFDTQCLTAVALQALPDAWLLPDADTQEYPELWETYYKAADIPEGYNPRLHMQDLPKRYWWMLHEVNAFRESAKQPAQLSPPTALPHL